MCTKVGPILGDRYFLPIRLISSRPLRSGCRAAIRPKSVRVKATTVTDKISVQRVIEDYHKYTVPFYVRPDKVLVSANGSRVIDSEGNSYLDFSGGIAVNSLGHSDSRIVEAMTQQASKIIHSSNLFHSLPAIELSKKLVEHSFADKVFLCNSGTEAIEAAIKFSRKWAAIKHGVDPYDPDQVGPHEIVSFTSAFHGRTMGALSLTPKQKYQSPFLPMLPGHRLALLNDLESAENAIERGKTCAVFVEPVQGEGGVNLATTEFLKGLRRLCDENDCLLVFDEIQCGFGRTAKLWAYEHHGVTPDVLTAAKPLAGGLPIGAVLMTDNVAQSLKPGDHGSTFAGNPVICNVANTVFDIVSDPDFLFQIERTSEYFRQKLESDLRDHSYISDIRQCGLLVGIECKGPVSEVVQKALKLGLIVITAGDGNIVRMAPALTVTEEEIDECVTKLKAAFG